MDKSANNNTYLLLIPVLIYLPFAESWFKGVLWGLNWQSPVFMEQVHHYLLYVKFLFVILGLSLLYRHVGKIRTRLTNTIFRNFYIFSCYVIGGIQLPFLCLGLLFSNLSQDNFDYIHKEQQFANATIYIYTADPGAMGKAYHYVNVKCPLPYQRYTLNQIARLDWIGNIGMSMIENELILKSTEGIDKVEHRLSLQNFDCQPRA